MDTIENWARASLDLIEFATGLNDPVYLSLNSPAGKNLQPDGSVLPTPFLDISSRVNSSSNEEGQFRDDTSYTLPVETERVVAIPDRFQRIHRLSTGHQSANLLPVIFK